MLFRGLMVNIRVTSNHLEVGCITSHITIHGNNQVALSITILTTNSGKSEDSGMAVASLQIADTLEDLQKNIGIA